MPGCILHVPELIFCLMSVKRAPADAFLIAHTMRLSQAQQQFPCGAERLLEGAFHLLLSGSGLAVLKASCEIKVVPQMVCIGL